MNEAEYLGKCAELKKKHNTELFQLAREYAYSNSTVQVGDFVTDHIGTIQVQSMQIYLAAHGLPMCLYKGLEYTKALKPSKRGTLRRVSQCNVIREAKSLEELKAIKS